MKMEISSRDALGKINKQAESRIWSSTVMQSLSLSPLIMYESNLNSHLRTDIGWQLILPV